MTSEATQCESAGEVSPTYMTRYKANLQPCNPLMLKVLRSIVADPGCYRNQICTNCSQKRIINNLVIAGFVAERRALGSTAILLFPTDEGKELLDLMNRAEELYDTYHTREIR